MCGLCLMVLAGRTALLIPVTLDEKTEALEAVIFHGTDVTCVVEAKIMMPWSYINLQFPSQAECFSLYGVQQIFGLDSVPHIYLL